MGGFLARPPSSFLTFKNQFVGKSGIEVGGPSQVFSRRGVFPVYSLVERLDNCNFSGATIWEGAIREGNTYRFAHGKPAGQQYVVEATDMKGLPSNAYDFGKRPAVPPCRIVIYGLSGRSGKSSSIRLLGQTGNFSRVSLSQACGSSPFSLAVPSRL